MIALGLIYRDCPVMAFLGMLDLVMLFKCLMDFAMVSSFSIGECISLFICDFQFRFPGALWFGFFESGANPYLLIRGLLRLVWEIATVTGGRQATSKRGNARHYIEQLRIKN